MTNVSAMTLAQRLQSVLLKAAALLPAEVGQRLRAFATWEAVSTIVVVTGIWWASHLVGAGFLADVAMITLGVVTLGKTAIEGTDKLASFASKTHSARTEADLNAAAKDLADAITLLGMDVIAIMLLRGGPRGTFKRHFQPSRQAPTYRQFRSQFPAEGPFRMYKPVVSFRQLKGPGEGGTNYFGQTWLGRNRAEKPAAEAFLDVRRALYHEQVHQWITAGFSLLGRPGLYLRWNTYKRSYILRYLEEAAAETRSQVLMRGLGRGDQIVSYKFPFDSRYEVTLTQIRSEMRGVLLGPVVVGGVTYQAYFRHSGQ